ncbi:hypothetical protein IH980_01735 [Patescibacteria group bacterium]|nr:hypothetical protein [Patescibacteria group bacterium]
MQNDTADKAIRAALEGNWEETVELNLTILKEEPDDITALNRLGKAYTELGDTNKARETYKRVLDLDKYNPIATKNIRRLKAKHKKPSPADKSLPTPSIKANFLEEPGKTKTTQLVRLTDADAIANLHIGQPVFLEAKKRSVSVTTEDDTYIGSLPDDLSFQLGKLIRGGNKYEALIKKLPESYGVQIFIRETERAKRFKNTPSFPITANASYYADLRPQVIKEEPIDIRETGEEEER